MGSVDVQKNFNEIPMLGMVPEQVASVDVTPTQEGRLWINKATHLLKVWLNGATKVVATTDDTRFTDARTPTAHTTTHQPGGSDPLPVDAVAGTGSLRTLGTGAQQAAGGTHTHTGLLPAPHASTHQPGGTDTMAVDAVAGTGSLRTIGTGALQAAAGNDSRFSDARTPSGTIGGDLVGSTWPTLNIGVGKVTGSHILDGTILVNDLGTSLVESGVSGGTGIAAAPCLRRSGYLTGDAMPGTARLDQIAANNVTAGTVDMNGYNITSLANPVNALDAVTKTYVDSVAQGLDAKMSVKYATVTATGIGGVVAGANIAAAAIPGIFDGAVISDLSGAVRVLVKNEASAQYNGIYEVATNNGSVITLARAIDFNTWAEIPSGFVFVEVGTTLADTGWVCTSDQSGTLNSTAITWTQFSGAGSFVDGIGLLKTGNVVDVRLDGTTIEAPADILQVKNGGITGAKLAAGAVDLSVAGGKVSGVLEVVNGGTGASAANIARANLGTPGTMYMLSPALTAGVYADILHNLGAAAKHVDFKVTSTGESVDLDWRDKAGVPGTTIQIKTDIPAGRAANYYTVSVTA